MIEPTGSQVTVQKRFTNGDDGMSIALSYAGVTASLVLLTMSCAWLVWYGHNQPIKKNIVGLGNNKKTNGSINQIELMGN